jgi:hypothetical protein
MEITSPLEPKIRRTRRPEAGPPRSVWILTLLLALVTSCSSPPQAEPAGSAWQDLFDGQSLEGWESIQFGGEGQVELRAGIALLPIGSPLTGLRYPAGLPLTSGYELEACCLRQTGTDFFCGLTIPVGDSFATVVLGGWGGALCGLSCIDLLDASENETKSFRRFESDTIYTLRIRVESHRVRAWVDSEVLFDFEIGSRLISPRTEVLPCLPLGLASYLTTAEFHSMRWRPLASIPD